MAWFNDAAVPGSPIAVWDSSQMVGGVMQDRIGSNHLNMRGGVPAFKFPVTGISGAGNLLTLPTAIALSGAKTAFYLGINSVDSGGDALIAFHNGASNVSDLIGFVIGNDSAAFLQCRKSNSSVNSNLGVGTDAGALWFYAVTMGGTTARQYANGRWVDSGFSQSTYIMSHIRGVAGWNADGSPYCLSGGDLMCAAGVYDSEATLAQLQALEALARAAYTIDYDTLGSRDADIQAQRQPLLGSLPASYASALKNAIAPSVPTGAGVVIGSVAEKGTPPAPSTPLVRRVVCIDEATGVQVGSTWSASDGSYAFSGLDASRRVTVLAYDHTDHYRAVVADKLLPS